MQRVRREIRNRREALGLSRDALIDLAAMADPRAPEIEVDWLKYLETRRQTMPEQVKLAPVLAVLDLEWRDLCQLYANGLEGAS